MHKLYKLMQESVTITVEPTLNRLEVLKSLADKLKTFLFSVLGESNPLTTNARKMILPFDA